MIKTFKKVDLKDVQTKRFQDNVDSAVTPILTKEIINGRLIEDIAVGTSAVEVQHKLDRRYIGWFIVKNNANSVVYQSASSDDTKFIKLTASATATISIWIF